ncbi:hypothetical protein B0H14DRAFT_2656675 [Mycena olivaceomarginata]|nr:hypothetical protein B0H14DRAFT_2656675 [Mycena olivaceomarginata]
MFVRDPQSAKSNPLLVKQTRDKLKENRRDVGLVERQHGSVDEMLSDRGCNGSGSDEEQGGLICLKKLEWMTPPESSLGFLLSGISRIECGVLTSEPRPSSQCPCSWGYIRKLHEARTISGAGAPLRPRRQTSESIILSISPILHNPVQKCGHVARHKFTPGGTIPWNGSGKLGERRGLRMADARTQTWSGVVGVPGVTSRGASPESPIAMRWLTQKWSVQIPHPPLAQVLFEKLAEVTHIIGAWNSFQPANHEVERQLELQMEAERNRRKQLLDTQAQINVAEGQRQRVILESEGHLAANLTKPMPASRPSSAEAEARKQQAMMEAFAPASQIDALAEAVAGNATYFFGDRAALGLGGGAGDALNVDYAEQVKRGLAKGKWGWMWAVLQQVDAGATSYPQSPNFSPLSFSSALLTPLDSPHGPCPRAWARSSTTRRRMRCICPCAACTCIRLGARVSSLTTSRLNSSSPPSSQKTSPAVRLSPPPPPSNASAPTTACPQTCAPDAAWARRAPSYQHMLIGLISGAMGPFSNAPIDTIKTHASCLQKVPVTKGASAFERIASIARAMWREEGFRSFYKGITPRVLRVAPGPAIVFAFYERVSRIMAILPQAQALRHITMLFPIVPRTRGRDIPGARGYAANTRHPLPDNNPRGPGSSRSVVWLVPAFQRILLTKDCLRRCCRSSQPTTERFFFLQSDTFPRPRWNAHHPPEPVTSTAIIEQMPTADAPVPARLRYAHSLPLPSKWELEKELATRFLSFGTVRSALNIFERLEMWEEVVKCWQAMERCDMGVGIVRGLLERRKAEAEVVLARGKAETTEALHANMDLAREVKLWCFLGDLEPENAAEQRAWAVSGQTAGRAMRSLGGYHFARAEYTEAISCLKKAPCRPTMPSSGRGCSIRARCPRTSVSFLLGLRLLQRAGREALGQLAVSRTQPLSHPSRSAQTLPTHTHSRVPCHHAHVRHDINDEPHWIGLAPSAEMAVRHTDPNTSVVPLTLFALFQTLEEAVTGLTPTLFAIIASSGPAGQLPTSSVMPLLGQLTDALNTATAQLSTNTPGDMGTNGDAQRAH